MIAQNGFGTQYVYTDAAIRQNVIPTLQSFASNPGTSDAEKSGYLNQIKVWQQILINNEINKRRAPLDKNISFHTNYFIIVINDVVKFSRNYF